MKEYRCRFFCIRKETLKCSLNTPLSENVLTKVIHLFCFLAIGLSLLKGFSTEQKE